MEENQQKGPRTGGPRAQPADPDETAAADAGGRDRPEGGEASTGARFTGIERDKLPDPPGDRMAGEAAADGFAADAPDPAGMEEDLAAQAIALRAEVSDLKDQLLRSIADLENARKRHAKEREDAVKYAASKFARDMLEVADNLRRALESVPEGAGRDDLPEPVRNLVEGVEATERTLLQAFERNGIQRIEALGRKFDPNLHEAMFELEDSSQPTGTVVQVLAPGFTIADRLLRPAQVGVSRGGQPASPRVDTTA